MHTYFQYVTENTPFRRKNICTVLTALIRGTSQPNPLRLSALSNLKSLLTNHIRPNTDKD